MAKKGIALKKGKKLSGAKTLRGTGLGKLNTLRGGHVIGTVSNTRAFKA